MTGKPDSRWQRTKQQFYSTIEKQIWRDKPYKVALGCALGIGINFFPTLGIGFIFAFVLAMLFRINRACATVTSLLAGPLVPLMYALDLFIGGIVLTPVTGKDNLVEFIVNQYSIALKPGNTWDKIFGFVEFFGSTFLLGAIVNAALFGTAFYFLVTFMLRKRADRIS